MHGEKRGRGAARAAAGPARRAPRRSSTCPAGEERRRSSRSADEPWWAFNYYLGDLASRVVLNIDVPTTGLDLVHLAAHEVYPGHHTEHAVKEQLPDREQGRIEEAIQLVPTPQAVLSEGIAEIGTDVSSTTTAREEAVRDPAQRTASSWSTRSSPSGSARRSSRSRTVGLDAALMIHEDGASRRGGEGVRRALEPRHARAGEAQRPLRHRPDLARVRDHVLGRARSLSRVRRRRSAALRALLTEHVRIGDLHRRSVDFRHGGRDRRREYGLFIDGAIVEPASGELRELREPATGELLARAAMAGEADVDRAVAARARRSTGLGEDARRPSARACCTRSPTRSSRTARSSPSSRRATSARRSRRSRPSSPARPRTSASSPRRSPRSPARSTRSAARCSSTR